MSTPAGAGPAAPADTDAAPAAPTHPAIGDAGWVAAPSVTDTAASTAGDAGGHDTRTGDAGPSRSQYDG